MDSVGGWEETMSDETGTSCKVATCGVSVSADKTRLSLYLGSAEANKSFEFIMSKDLALHMSSTIQKLASPPSAPITIRRGGRA